MKQTVRKLGSALRPGLAALLLAPAAAAQPTFTDVTVAAGVDYLQYAIPDPLVITGPEYMNGGAAAGDFDGDGWVDLIVTRYDAPDILFRNLGNGTFDDVTATTGLQLHDLNSNGVAWGDVDNDGDADLYVTTQEDTRFHLFINDGSGGFTEEAVARGAAVDGPDEHFGYSVALGDYDRDGWLDIHVNEWRRDAFNPTAAASNARLLRNLGAASPGHFTDVTAAAGVAMDSVPLAGGVQGTTTFTSRFSDFDGDGWPDLAIAADFGSSRLFWNNGDGTFSDGTAAAGVGTDENGMGSAVGDIDGDGDLDWFVTSIYDPDDLCQCDNGLTGNRLYRNMGNRVFWDFTEVYGVRDGGWGWGAAMFDYDNDGDLDLAMNNGQDWPDPYVPGADAFNADAARLWRNDGGSNMTEVAAAEGITATGSGKGILSFDYDRDGDLDLFLVTNSGHPFLYRNDTPAGNDWLRVDVRGRDSNADGVGARVEVFSSLPGPPMLREISSGSHFLSQSERIAHFGLGQASPDVTVRVTWPATGRVHVLGSVSPNQTLMVMEPPPKKRCGLLGIEVLLPLGLLARRRSSVRRG